METNIIFVVAGVKPFVSVLRRAGIKTYRLGCVVVDEFGRSNIEGGLPLAAAYQQLKT